MRPTCETPFRTCHGFTAVELLLTVLVLGVAAALVVPRLGNADTSRLRAAALQVAADIELIQSEAMSHADEARVIDFYVGDGTGYELANVRNESTKADNELLWNKVTSTPYRVRFGQAGHEHLTGVWLAKSNLGDFGHLQFGAYGQVEAFTVDPTLVFASGGATLTLTVNRTTGMVEIAPSYQPLSSLGSISVPGDAGIIETVSTSPY